MNALIVVARSTIAGRVKPRLGAQITSKLATKFYQACAEHVIEESAKVEGIVHYLFYSDGSREQADEWMRAIHLQDSMVVQTQSFGADAGFRTRDAFQRVFDAGAVKAVLLCADVPDLDADVIRNAFTTLESSEVVFGPAYDGGYYLVGLTSHQPSIFEDLPWGTANLLQVCENKAKSLGLNVAPVSTLPRLYDIDTRGSLKKWSELSHSTKHPLSSLATSILRETQFVLDALAETGYALVSP